MPSSQADMRPLRNVDSLLGQEIDCKIIKLIRKRSNVVVSRKEAMEEEANQRKAVLLEHLQEGVELTGRVKNLTILTELLSTWAEWMAFCTLRICRGGG